MLPNRLCVTFDAYQHVGSLTRSLLLLLLLLATGCGKGRMPSESVAVSIRKDAVRWIESHSTNKASELKLPASVSRLKPIRVETYDGGLLLVFRQRFVEDYG